MWGHISEYSWGGGMGLGMLLFWGLLIAGVVMLLRCSKGSASCGKQDGAKSALGILSERFARGEIERDEFEQKKRVLKGESHD